MYNQFRKKLRRESFVFFFTPKHQRFFKLKGTFSSIKIIDAIVLIGYWSRIQEWGWFRHVICYYSSIPGMKSSLPRVHNLTSSLFCIIQCFGHFVIKSMLSYEIWNINTKNSYFIWVDLIWTFSNNSLNFKKICHSLWNCNFYIIK